MKSSLSMFGVVLVSLFAVGCADGADGDDAQREELGETESALTNSACPSGSVCLFEDSKHRGSKRTVKGSIGCHNVGSNLNFNDEASSMINRSGHRVRLYKDANCSNNSIYKTYGVNESPSSFGGFNDWTSSIRVLD